jgi:hypothetical protein
MSSSGATISTNRAAAASFLAVLFAVLYHSAAEARYSLKYLWPRSSGPPPASNSPLSWRRVMD